MTKKETLKFIVQMIASIATAIVTAPKRHKFLDKPSGIAERHGRLNNNHEPLTIKRDRAHSMVCELYFCAFDLTT